MSRVKRLLLCLTLLATLLLTVPLTQAETVNLEDTDWRLVSLADDNGALLPVAEGVSAGVRFAGGKLSGKAGCNSFFGQYQRSQPGQVSIGEQIGSTMMGCPPPLAELEQRYLALLPQMVAYHIDGDALVMMDPQGGERLAYEVVVPLTLEGVDWQATGINNGRGGVVNTITTERSTARFENGEVSGNAGCNRYSAGYTLADGKLSVGPARSTRMMCAEPGLMDQEQQFLAALARSRVVQLRERTLQLRDEDGALQIGFTASAE